MISRIETGWTPPREKHGLPSKCTSSMPTENAGRQLQLLDREATMLRCIMSSCECRSHDNQHDHGHTADPAHEWYAASPDPDGMEDKVIVQDVYIVSTQTPSLGRAAGRMESAIIPGTFASQKKKEGHNDAATMENRMCGSHYNL
eukprot:scaffold118581_cov65-Attheya_sp.AAC.2